MILKPEELNMVEIRKEAVDQYIDFSNLIKSTLENPEFFENYSKKDLIELLENGSKIYLFKYHEFAIASCMLLKISKNRLKELGILDENGIELGPQAVFLDMRGNGIQKFMIKTMEDISKELKYSYIIGVVQKEDEIANSNFKKLHYQIVKEIDNSIIYQKDLTN